MDMLRVTARWNGFPGAPGYSNFYFAGGGGAIGDEQQVADRVAEAFEEISATLPGSVRIELDAEVPVIDSDTGLATDYRIIEPPPAVTGDVTATYSGPSGAVVNWRTDDLRFGRRIRGRTFLVPLASSVYQNDGTLTEATLTRLRAFADTLTSWDFDSEFGVWSRPRDGAGGVFATVTNFSVPDMAAVLRSRRD